MTLKHTITGALVAGAAYAAMAGVALADTDVVVNTTGAGSDNAVVVEKSSEQTVVQTNEFDVTNNVDVRNNTGNNRANFNTGGNNTIDTGNAVSDVFVTNTGGGNDATVDECGCDEDVDVALRNTGFRSTNRVRVDVDHTNVVVQDNWTRFRNTVDVRQNTGRNRTSGNTRGTNRIFTGNARSLVDLLNTGGGNRLR